MEQFLGFFSGPEYWMARLLFERGLALIYFLGFLSAWNQFPALLGANGLLPVPAFLRRTRFRDTPSLFHWYHSDNFFLAVMALGMVLSMGVLVGAFSWAPLGVKNGVWLVMWFFYLSVVTVGQRFYSFGWESMLVEAGFFAVFLGPSWMEPSLIPILALTWMLFRVELGAGLIKIRGDQCWRDLTCLHYHHETQPLLNPLSRFFHFLPSFMLKGGVVFSHFVQLIAPFALFLPQPVANVAGALIVVHQLILIAGGNYAFLNWLTVVLAFVVFSNGFFGVSVPAGELAARPLWWEGVLIGLGLFTLVLSVRPALNLCSGNQLMNCSFNSWHLVNAYGAFGSVTKKRYEIVLEGRGQDAASPWREYEFKAKPGDTFRRPPQVAPYHLRLDWLMWFVPLSVSVSPYGITVPGYEYWFIRLVKKLLQADQAMLKLLKTNPFKDHKPYEICVRFYLYQLTTPKEFRESGQYWKRTYIDDYLPPISLQELQARVSNV